MNEDEGFVRAIRDDPDDAALRLVYADWLDERSDPRGEYLRLGCKLSEIQARMAQLQEHIEPKWVAAVRESRSDPRQVRLRSGRTVYLRELRQSGVYEGLLEGLPTTEMNQRMIAGMVAAERTGLSGHDPYLIQPRETPLEYPGDRPYPFGQPASIPRIVCIGRFSSFEPARDASRDFSELVVIWFQDEFALPIDVPIWEQLLAINWQEHAIDGDY
jgi:uncharacterized protein (TIGR02996 family)